MEREQIILKCSQVGFAYSDFSLEDISFEMPKGYIMGVIGRNGSGKTTLVKALLGSIKAEGERYINGISLNEKPADYKSRIGYVFNTNPFPKYWNAMDCGKVYGNYYASFDVGRYRSLLKLYDVPDRLPIKKLSKGQSIRQQLAFALSYDAELYIMDEPNSNLDIEFRDSFYKALRELVSDGTRSIIYVSHLVEEMEQFADHLLWLHKGRIKYCGTIDNLKDTYQVLESDVDLFLDAAGRKEWEQRIVGKRENSNHQELLVSCKLEEVPQEFRDRCRYGDLKEIMYYVERGKVK